MSSPTPSLAVVLLVCLAFAAFVATFVSLFLYVRSVRGLIEIVEQRYPDLWHVLGQPKMVWVRGTDGGGAYHLQPLMPFLAWLWENSPRGLQGGDADVYRQVRGRFIRGIGGLVLAGTLVLLLVGAAPSGSR